jgi:hypothetical protein
MVLVVAAVLISAPAGAEVTYPSASVQCTSIGYPVYVCTGTVVDGVGPYTPYWGWKGTWNEWPSGPGPTFSIQMVCKTTTADWVSFKACDRYNRCSNVARAWCGPGMPMED